MNALGRTLVFRSDANAITGAGHIMRCLALAQFWQSIGGRAAFLLSDSDNWVGTLLQHEGMEVVQLDVKTGSNEDALRVTEIATNRDSWVVADGYRFGGGYQSIIKRTGSRLMVIDDYGHADHYCADLVLNQNIYASEHVYSNRGNSTTLLLGTNYALLRKEFARWRTWTRLITNDGFKVLVTLGGADPVNATAVILQAICELRVPNLKVVAIVGPSYRFGQPFAAPPQGMHELKILRNVSDMSALMAWADLAISGAGSTSWELAFMGLPAITVAIADNQQRIADAMNNAGVTIGLRWEGPSTAVQVSEETQRLLQSEMKRREMSKKGKLLVDGLGTLRTAQHLVN